MKTLLLLAAIALLAIPQTFSAAAQQDDWEQEYAERDEIRQSYQLTPGARVEVSGINGRVEIETTTGNTAEVHVVRSAKTREDLEYRKVIIEHTPTSLIVRTEKERGGGRNREVRQRVTLRIPRQVDLNTHGVNGRVSIGQVDGPVKVSGVNGRVEIGQAVGYSDISGVNGRVTLTIVKLSERGIHVSGVNGGVDMRFSGELNADLDVSGINGNVDADVPNVTLEKLSRNSFRGRIGSGGIPITVDGVNGRVRLARAGTEL